jgi:hypothetical protein
MATPDDTRVVTAKRPLLTPDDILLVAAEIRESCGREASTAYLLEHAEELGIGKETIESARAAEIVEAEQT